YLSHAVRAHDGKVAYLRWHDSGDLFHIDYSKAILQVCRGTPSVLHWLPTRMGGLLASLVRSGERLPPNLAVQVSCHRGGVFERAQHSAVAEIRKLQPEARVGVTYTHAGPRSRTVLGADLQTIYGEGACLCPATVAKTSAERVCTGCRRCWSQTNPKSPVIYA